MLVSSFGPPEGSGENTLRIWNCEGTPHSSLVFMGKFYIQSPFEFPRTVIPPKLDEDRFF